jgi:hypothetical protein
MRNEKKGKQNYFEMGRPHAFWPIRALTRATQLQDPHALTPRARCPYSQPHARATT